MNKLFVVALFIMCLPFELFSFVSLRFKNEMGKPVWCTFYQKLNADENDSSWGRIRLPSDSSRVNLQLNEEAYTILCSDEDDIAKGRYSGYITQNEDHLSIRCNNFKS